MYNICYTLQGDLKLVITEGKVFTRKTENRDKTVIKQADILN